MGTGTLLAFPGSMCGAFLCGMLYNTADTFHWLIWENCSEHPLSADF